MSRIKHIIVKPANPEPYVNKVFVALEKELYTFAIKRMNGNEVDAGEVFQKAAYKVARYSNGLLKCKDQPSQLRYLKKVIDNCIADYLEETNGQKISDSSEEQNAPAKKVSPRQKPLSLDNLLENNEIIDSDRSVEDEVERKLLVEDVLRHFERRDIEIMQLWSFGFTQEEIAERMGLSRTTVGIRFRNSKEKLNRMGYRLLEEVES